MTSAQELIGLRNKDRPVSSTPKGLNFIRGAIAQAVGGNAKAAELYAERRWNPGVVDRVKASIGSLNAQSLGGSAMLSSESGASEFFDLVYAASVIGRLNVRRVPFYTRMVVQVEGPTAEWVDGGAGYGVSAAVDHTPIGMATFSALDPFALGSLVVITNELLRDASVNAEMQIRDMLVRALAAKLDLDFISTANSGTTNIKPASVTNGVTTNNSPLEAIFDWSDLFKGDPNAAVILLNPYTAARLQGATRPYVGAYGGTLGGWPVVTSTAVGVEEIIFMDPQHIAVAMGNPMINVSTQGDVNMLDVTAQTALTPAASDLVSLFQCNLTGMLATITANWVNTRPGSVLVFNTQQYGL
jgi:hypothetical protein